MAWCFSTRASVATVLTTHSCVSQCLRVNTLRPRQNGCHFADDIFKCILLNENVWIAIRISWKFIPNGTINNNSALVQIIAWRRPGDKPLSAPMMVSLPTHICLTRPQWVNTLRPRKHGGHIADVDSVFQYHKTSNISCTLVGNKIVDHSDVVGASPVGAAPTTSSFST